MRGLIVAAEVAGSNPASETKFTRGLRRKAWRAAPQLPKNWGSNMESKPDGVWDCLLSNSSGASWIRFETDALRHIAYAGRQPWRRRHRGHLAQLVERRHDMADVGGSSPSVPTKFQQHDAGLAGAGRRQASTCRSSPWGVKVSWSKPPGSEPGIRGFESHLPRQQQARSSVGRERRATNAEVRGSIPFGPTK